MSDDGRERFVADFARLSPTLPGAQVPWLARARRDALERFARIGLPTPRDEEWKYTSMAALAKRRYSLAPTSGRNTRFTAAQLAALPLARVDGHRIVFVDGRHAPEHSTVGALPAGVILDSMATLLDRAPAVWEACFADQRQHTVFAALNTAFAADGLHVYLPRGAVIEEPIHAVFISTTEDAVTHPRNLVVAEEGAAATIIEQYVGCGDVACLTNAVTQIFLAGRATVAHYKVQQESSRAVHVAGIHAAQAQASRLELHSIALGAALSRHDITTTFDADGCETALNGLYLVGGRQHVDHHTRIDHAHPHGTSREYYKGILDGASRGVFNGKVIVHRDAQRSDAQLSNHNLLLSKTAEVDTKPQLEIDADDVKCAHGATVGQLDDAQMFYLRSRGVDLTMARSLLTYAFANDVIERIRILPLRAHLAQVLLARLPQGERIRELA